MLRLARPALFWILDPGFSAESSLPSTPPVRRFLHLSAPNSLAPPLLTSTLLTCFSAQLHIGLHRLVEIAASVRYKVRSGAVRCGTERYGA
ncbi:hypothetical protein CGLO_17642 [Colletotrichum gloeosporioides Cg-14]|uniref:Uncharacterized protein n=1 Tax=Colletotrichum gloeosporioides (strain Cg-14) TaxID=1237896 RepID=T0KWE8_COLGC|nr:hypothetical protein CGLO_17642 [Colletotrichum gloeosporioides Cg-14]